MTFKVQEVDEADFPAVVRSMWFTYENPRQDIYHIFAPVNAYGCETKEQSIEESTKRLWEWHVSDPSSRWLKVADGDKIAGGALWKVNKTNPYEGPHDEEEAYWHPPGSQREFANQVLAQHEAARSQMATRPHLYLNIIFTHPDYQRRGIGSLLLDWGIKKAAEMDVEIWLNAWRYGLPLYEKYGFVTVEHHITKPESSEPDEAWRACERDFADLEEWVMWRPRDGPYVEGRSVKLWETSKDLQNS